MSTTPTLFHWFLPTGGDSSNPGAAPSAELARASADVHRAPTVDYLASVAQAAETAGFTAILTPVGLGCPDPWVITSALASRVERLRFITAVRPSLASATLLAQQADTFRRLFGPRLILNIVTGGDPVEQAAYGAVTDHDERYQVTDEALSIIGPLLAGEVVNQAGRHHHVQDAQLVSPTPQHHVPLHFGGASAPALEIAARHADTYLMWGEPPAAIQGRLDGIRGAEQRAGRKLHKGLRIHILTRDTSDQAWAEAARIQDSFDPQLVSAMAQRKSRMDSVGQSRMVDLHTTATVPTVTDLTIAPNLWTGIGLVRDGVATAIVGSHDEVAARLAEYAELGVDEFILSGYPHREEATRVGEEVIPRVHRLLTR